MFLILEIIFLFCLGVASFFSMMKKENRALFFQTLGIILFAVFIAWLWITLHRPPFKTMGETRIWYSFFLALMGGATYWRWKMGFLLTFTNLLASVFVVVTICKPEIQSQTLMPALQSGWFIPHVAVYMFGYAAIGCAVVLGILDFYFINHKGHKGHTKENTIKCNQLVKIGAAALGIGLCLGALWAKKAWGQYWSWDIKESAALITWAIFLLYLHLQKLTKINRKILWVILIIGFLSLNFTWLGVKYLPAAKKSPHTFYSAEGGI
jgi:ABC-type transport system involved in cytochrome c biogenesis permease subunit